MAKPDGIDAPDSPGRERQQQQRSRRRPLPLLPRRRVRRPRSSGVPAAAATAAIALVALAAAPPGASHSHHYYLAHAAQPPSIRKKPAGATRHNHPPEATSTSTRGRGGAGNAMADAAMAAEGVFFRSSSSGNRDRAVIVQPDSLPRRQEEETAPHGHTFTQSYGGDDQVAASEGWQQRRRQAQEEPSWEEEEPSQSRGRPSDFAGQRPPYGLAANSNVEYYRDGKPMRQVSSSYENTDDNVTFEEFMEAQQLQERGGGEGQGKMKSSSMHVAEYNYGASDGGGGGRYEDYEEWLANRGYGQTQARQQQQARARGAPMSPPESRSKQKMPDRGAAMNPPKSKSTPLEDLDPVSGKQVILRPRMNNDALPSSKPLGLPPMGSSIGGGASQSNSGGGDGEAPEGREQPVVYYYDPQALQSSLPDRNGGEIGVPELALPEVVYDSSGRALRLEQVHAGGRNEVFLEVKPRAVWGTSDFPSGWDDTLGSLRSRFVFDLPSSPDGARQSQDQLIVIFTVATMAVMVGALSAKRLRSRRMLESCMHPELEDDDWDADEFGSTVGSVAATPRYDKKFDGSAAVGASANEGGRRSGSSIGAYYSDNESGGGGLHWRGDMEKFDV